VELFELKQNKKFDKVSKRMRE